MAKDRRKLLRLPSSTCIKRAKFVPSRRNRNVGRCHIEFHKTPGALYWYEMSYSYYQRWMRSASVGRRYNREVRENYTRLT